MTKIQDLIDFGIPRACFCRSDVNLIAPDDGLIYTGLTNGYNKRIIKLFVAYFGAIKVLKALDDRKDKVSAKLYNDVLEVINEENKSENF